MPRAKRGREPFDTCEVVRRMAPDGIVEAVDVTADGVLGLGSRLEEGAPDELGFQCFEERLDHGVVIAVAFAGYRDLDAALGEFGLIIARAILGSPCRNGGSDRLAVAAWRGLAECFESQLPMQAIADGPGSAACFA